MPDTVRAGVSLDRRLKRTIGLLTSGVLVVLAGLRGADLRCRREQNLKAGERRAANLVEHRGQLDPGLGFLPKPYASDQLVQAVRSALRGVSPPWTGRESARP